MNRDIAWYVDKEDNHIAGIEATETGWAVVDSSANRVYEEKGFSKESREKIERYYEKFICLRKNSK